MDTSPKYRSGCRRWAPIAALVLLLAAALVIVLAVRTPAGRALWNVVDYRVRLLSTRWFGNERDGQRATGAISGVVRDSNGRGLSEAVVLVAEATGEYHEARTDELGTYRIPDVPSGDYIPVASRWGYDIAVFNTDGDERTIVEVRPATVAAGIDFSLSPHTPWQPDLSESPTSGPPETGMALFPAEVYAQRVPVTFTNDGLVITTTLVYRATESEAVTSSETLPVLVASYPSEPMNWDRVSVAVASSGYLVVATGPSPQRGLDIAGMARDLVTTVAYLQAGQLPDAQPADRMGWLSGSFSSVIMYQALQEERADIDALVVVGGISDAFLGVQALYDEDLEIPPRYTTAIASLGRPDRHPEVYLGYSPAFHAADLPPTLVVHTTGDEVIPHNQATRLAEALDEAGVTHELFLYEDTTHYLDQINVTPDTAELYRRLSLFLDTHVRGVDE